MSMTLARNDEAVEAIVVLTGLKAMTVPGAVQREYGVAVKVAHRRLLKVVAEVVQREYEVAVKVANRRLLNVYLRHELW